jgi:hypothetical protein
MSENILTVPEADRAGIDLITVSGADRQKAACPICARVVPGFELAKLSAEEATERGAEFACGHCRSGWGRETE